MLAAVAVVMLRDDDAGEHASGCLSGLVDHLPEDVSWFHGANLARARGADILAEGSPDGLTRAAEIGVVPDPRTAAGSERGPEAVGYEVADVAC